MNLLGIRWKICS